MNENVENQDVVEWDLIDNKVCWQRSDHIMPRLRMVTELEEFLIPWVHISLIKYESSYRIIEIHTSLGMTFLVRSTSSQKKLCELLQLERVRCIYPIDGVTVKVAIQRED